MAFAGLPVPSVSGMPVPNPMNWKQLILKCRCGQVPEQILVFVGEESDVNQILEKNNGVHSA